MLTLTYPRMKACSTEPEGAQWHHSQEPSIHAKLHQTTLHIPEAHTKLAGASSKHETAGTAPMTVRDGNALQGLEESHQVLSDRVTEDVRLVLTLHPDQQLLQILLAGWGLLAWRPGRGGSCRRNGMCSWKACISLV